MKEIYRDEIADWYEDSGEDEVLMMLGKRAFNALGYPKEFRHLPQDLKDMLKRMFEYELVEGENKQGIDAIV